MIFSDGGRGKRLCVLLVAIALAPSMTSVLLSKKSVEVQGSFDATAIVSRVVDDDTVEIPPAIGGIEDVRLIGVDTRLRRGTPGGRT